MRRKKYSTDEFERFAIGRTERELMVILRYWLSPLIHHAPRSLSSTMKLVDRWAEGTKYTYEDLFIASCEARDLVCGLPEDSLERWAGDIVLQFVHIATDAHERFEIPLSLRDRLAFLAMAANRVINLL